MIFSLLANLIQWQKSVLALFFIQNKDNDRLCSKTVNGGGTSTRETRLDAFTCLDVTFYDSSVNMLMVVEIHLYKYGENYLIVCKREIYGVGNL